MAIVSKTSPKGVDFAINAIQDYLFAGLTTLGWTNYECYPRAYKNKKGDNVIIPEISKKGSITEYTEVLFNDSFNATSFCIVSDEGTFVRDEQLYIRDVSIIFQVKLSELYSSVTDHRADEEMHNEIMSLLNDNDDLFFGDISFTTGIDNVYNDLNISNYNKEGVNNDDMSEFHVVKFDITTSYDFLNCT